MLMGKEERRGVRSIFQPTFGFNGGLERSARTGFRGCRFVSSSQSLVSQLPVRLLTINRGQGEHKGRRKGSIGNALTAEVSLDFIVPKGHSVKVVCRTIDSSVGDVRKLRFTLRHWPRSPPDILEKHAPSHGRNEDDYAR
jgi:hypothetical protein